MEDTYVSRPHTNSYLDFLEIAAAKDVEGLWEAHKHYGNSCLKRGGVGLFMMLARKWDRLERQVERHGWDAFLALTADTRSEGVIDDIRDLRRYLLILEAEALFQGLTAASTEHRDNK